MCLGTWVRQGYFWAFVLHQVTFHCQFPLCMEAGLAGHKLPSGLGFEVSFGCVKTMGGGVWVPVTQQGEDEARGRAEPCKEGQRREAGHRTEEKEAQVARGVRKDSGGPVH